jgi:hypothetical protein
MTVGLGVRDAVQAQCLKNGRFAPLAAADAAKIIANILEKPEGRAGHCQVNRGWRYEVEPAKLTK